MATERVLIVCARNICRSPYLELALSQAVQSDGVEIASAGVLVAGGRPMCPVAADALPDCVRARAAEHRAHRLDEATLKAADLVLLASVQERAAAAQIDPAVRSRAFTVREALLLYRGGAEVEPGAGLRRLTEVLHRARGTLGSDSPVAPSRLPWRRKPLSPLDIPDRHREAPSAHRRLFRELDADLVDLVAMLEAAAR